uniref:Uncharacterized protein n=1 Tax=Cannabis sativa TaxID=3483 RepID=A0A803Q713_CANSA
MTVPKLQTTSKMDTLNSQSLLNDGNIAGSSDDIGGVEECLTMGPKEHEQTHNDDWRSGNEAGDGGLHEEITHEELGSSSRQDHPRPAELPAEGRGTPSLRGNGVVQDTG